MIVGALGLLVGLFSAPLALGSNRMEGPGACSLAFEKGDPEEGISVYFLLRNQDPEGDQPAGTDVYADYLISILISSELAEAAVELDSEVVSTREMLHLEAGTFFAKVTGPRRSILALSKRDDVQPFLLWAGNEMSRETALQYALPEAPQYTAAEMQEVIAMMESGFADRNFQPQEPATVLEKLVAQSWASGPEDMDSDFLALPSESDVAVTVLLEPRAFVREFLAKELVAVEDETQRLEKTRAFYREIYVNFMKYIDEIRAEGAIVNYEIRDEERRKKFESALKDTNKKFGKTLKNLA